MNEKLQNLKAMLTDEESNKRIVAVGVFAVLGTVAFVMTVINILTDKGLLTVATGAFSLLSFLNLFFTRIGKHTRRVALILFTVEMAVMFTYFVVSGEPEGFSAFWICMIPSFGMLLYGRKVGSFVSALMLLDIIFLLWTPLGQSFVQYEYTQSFVMRFPVLYIAFYLMAFVLETLRVFAYEETKHLQLIYEELSVRDQLTGLYNRQGMYELLRERLTKDDTDGAFIIFDIDDFKRINDTYGHGAGDDVLKEFARLIKQNVNMTVCRWGGEEFAGICFGQEVTDEDLQTFLLLVEHHEFVADGNRIRMTVSAGVCRTKRLNTATVQKLASAADTALYDAKGHGKNRIVSVPTPQEIA